MESAAISGAQWVVGKALSPLSDGLVEAWAATSELGPNIEALKMELLYAQAMLNNVRGREIHNPALAELLQRLRGLAYGAEDVLDELDYFRIQDELEGTFEAAVDDDGRGCFHNLVRDGRHTAKAAAKQLGCCSCSALIHDYKPEDPCKCVRRLASRAHAVGKRFLCSSPQLVRCDGRGDDNRHAPRVPKLKFDRVDVSRKMKCIVEQLKPVCSKVSSILDLELLGSAVAKLELLGSAVAKLESLGSNRAIGNVASSTTSRSITSSQALEPKLYGREPEKNTIVEDITRGAYIHRDLTVVPIVGPGGIGKTTLTQYIYNSQEVQDHFQIRVWICVSLDFSVYRLTQEILSSLPKAEDEKNERTDDAIKNLDQLQKLVQRRLKNKRFLLVLDDIWSYGNEDEWKRFLVPFTEEQGKGNIVLATTRFLHVAEIVKKGDKSLPLEGLGPEEYWSLFLACVFDELNQQCNDGELLQIGKKIVEKLKGSPLAAKTVGRLLRKNLTVDHWTRVLESKEWASQTSDHDIMPALKLSYDFLPFQLQQCFSCCALFPEDYKFDCEELIHFWIGLDILRPSHTTKRIEEIGRNNLNELVSYGFFIEVTGKSDKQYVMHDLLHDLALKVSSQECLHLASSSPRPVEIAPSIYHLSISLSPANSGDGIMDEKFRKELGKIKNILKSENLHTLMLFGDYDANFLRIFSDLFKDAKKLRVVHLSTMYYSVESLLHNFSKLIHLCYLRVVSQYGSKEHLPSSISRFYQLRVLDIRQWCGSHSSLRDMANLVKLRHFLSYSVEHHSNISNVGKLDSLQELQRFEVRKESNGFELRELGHLEELGGSLCIYNLENVQASEAHEAKLMYKRQLQKLTLSWNKGRSNANPDVEDQILESLRPHSNLHEVCIDGHGGVTCPTWLGTNLFTKGLEALRLDGVAWKFLPPLGEMWLIDESGEEYFGCIRGLDFHNLRRLELIGLPRFRKWVANEVCPWYFSLIEELTVGDCPELTELPFSNYNCYSSEGDVNGTCFPRLTTLKISNCEKLLSLPPIPYGRTLYYVYLECAGRGLKWLSYYGDSDFLSIVGNDDLPKLDETVLAFQNLTQQHKLLIHNCPPLAEKHLQMLTSLKTLKIHGSRILFLPLERSDVKWQVPVNSLTIGNSEASGKELTRLFSHLPELSDLNIRGCEKITQLGIEVEQQKQIAEDVVTEDAVAEQDEEEDGLLLLGPHLTGSLQELRICSCSKLVLTSGGGGLQAMCSLTKIAIDNCPKFLSAYKTSSLSSSRPFPSSLQSLTLDGRMEGMETLAPLSNLTSLEGLSLIGLGEDLRCESLWPLLTQGQLKELKVRGSPNFFAGWDPAWGATSQEEQPLLSPSSKLQELSTDDIAGVLAAPICRLLSRSLTKLSIAFNKVTERFTKEQENALSLLSSLQELRLSVCDKLRCLPAGLNKLTNLHRLEISCPAIRSLPKNGLPSSLQGLYVSDCGNEELTQRCRRLMGTIPEITL